MDDANRGGYESSSSSDGILMDAAAAAAGNNRGGYESSSSSDGILMDAAAAAAGSNRGGYESSSSSDSGDWLGKASPLRQQGFRPLHMSGLVLRPKNRNAKIAALQEVHDVHSLSMCECEFVAGEDLDSFMNFLEGPLPSLKIMYFANCFFSALGGSLIHRSLRMRPRSNLKQVQLCGCQFEPTAAAHIIRALNDCCPCLRELTITGYVVNAMAGGVTEDHISAALKQLLPNKNTLRRLDFTARCGGVGGECDGGEEAGGYVLKNFYEVASSLSENTSLKALEIGCRAMDDAFAVLLGNALVGNMVLIDLYISRCDFTLAGWHAFASCLWTGCGLEELRVCEDHQRDGSLAIGNAIAFSPSCRLKRFGAKGLTLEGWGSFLQSLRTPNASLEYLFMEDGIMDDNLMNVFADAMAHNTSLREFTFPDQDDEHHPIELSVRGWEALLNVLCNKTNIHSIFASNHWLSEVDHPDVFVRDEDLDDAPESIWPLLELNSTICKRAVARKKILVYHFQNGGANLKDLSGVGRGVWPHAIEWAARDNDGLSVLYELFKRIVATYKAAK